jgi:hypothetical protein
MAVFARNTLADLPVSQIDYRFHGRILARDPKQATGYFIGPLRGELCQYQKRRTMLLASKSRSRRSTKHCRRKRRACAVRTKNAAAPLSINDGDDDQPGYDFLTMESNVIVEPIHPKAMPVSRHAEAMRPPATTSLAAHNRPTSQHRI